MKTNRILKTIASIALPAFALGCNSTTGAQKSGLKTVALESDDSPRLEKLVWSESFEDKTSQKCFYTLDDKGVFKLLTGAPVTMRELSKVAAQQSIGEGMTSLFQTAKKTREANPKPEYKTAILGGKIITNHDEVSQSLVIVDKPLMEQIERLARYAGDKFIEDDEGESIDCSENSKIINPLKDSWGEAKTKLSANPDNFDTQSFKAALLDGYDTKKNRESLKASQKVETWGAVLRTKYLSSFGGPKKFVARHAFNAGINESQIDGFMIFGLLGSSFDFVFENVTQKQIEDFKKSVASETGLDLD